MHAAKRETKKPSTLVSTLDAVFAPSEERSSFSLEHGTPLSFYLGTPVSSTGVMLMEVQG